MAKAVRSEPDGEPDRNSSNGSLPRTPLPHTPLPHTPLPHTPLPHTPLPHTPEARTRVFLSYSRQDKAEADRLRADLMARDIEVFQDIEDTLPGEEWWRRLIDLIRQADTVVFLLSPRSGASKVCADEVAHAVSLNKRLFPVVIETVDWSAIPDGLAKVHSVFLDAEAGRARALENLGKALLVDIGWVRAHTRYLERAQVWDNQGRARGDLVAGSALERAESWLVGQPVSAPPPTALQREFVQASRAAASRRQRLWVLGSGTTAVLAVALALFA